ncbi:unnamed protein product [Rotaria magnacalcarata]|uniref:Arginine deiminase n=1 Tax=Rotaria magnacalcarata TaxID=392030 RepID=A0A816LDS9_9BILA|nr:unnamed protein product [Rotaria magnacalcarata]CAF1667603.1 unnamed protein product [Rotaria magnacalcarata]CAF1935399.1 unnamed protein product [Rotaria magnacalcarata]CAF3798620.1 unnamed protein product [Rotaria magnacalcarata]CAF3801726.1 unnamed protein product [Rotaria magnacalcarata]
MKVSGSITKDTLAEFGAGVESECGKLDIVVMHRPDRELLRLTNDNLRSLLFDGLPNINETHKSHDFFSQYLRDHETHVFYLADLLRETLKFSDEARHTLIDGIVAHSYFTVNHKKTAAIALRQWLLERTIEQLIEDVITGVYCSIVELGTSHSARIILEANDSVNKFIIPPLPNLLFIRDAFSIIEKNVFIWQMAKSARQNEPLLLRTIFRFHPYLSTSGLNIVEWQTKNSNDEYPTIEGGDVAYLGQGILLIGCSERTNRTAIEDIASTGLFRQTIVVIIPPQRDYMHLDTILSSVGKHAFALHSPLAEIMEIFTVETRNIENNVFPKPMWISHGFNIRNALRKLLNEPKLIFYDAQNEQTSVYEQKQCRHNVVVIDDCHVVTYAGADPANGIINQMTRNNICQVGQIPSQGLFEGGGGAHCMTNAIRRRAK